MSSGELAALIAVVFVIVYTLRNAPLGGGRPGRVAPSSNPALQSALEGV